MKKIGRKLKDILGKIFPKKKRIRRIIIAVVLVAIVGGLVFNSISAKNAVMQFPAETVVKGDIETTVSTSGVVESEKSKIFYAPMIAKVSDVTVELGDSVKKGDTILSYDTQDLEFTQRSDELGAQASENSYQSSIAESNKQQNIYNNSVTALENLEVMIQAQKDYITALKHNVQDEKSKKKLELYEERYRINRRINGLSVQEYIEVTEGVRSSQAQAQNDLSEVNKKLEALDENKDLTAEERVIEKEQEKLVDMETLRDDTKSDKKSSESSILNDYKKKELEATAQKSKISEEQAKAHLEEAMQGIKAEFNGIITELDINEGFVTEAGTKLLKLESSDDVRVSVSLSKYDLSKVKVGQKAKIVIAGKDYKGTVQKIDRMAVKNDSGTRLVTAEVHVDNPDDNIYLGIEGKATIYAAKSENTLLVPISAVNTDQDGDFCFVIADGMIQKKPVKIGLTSEASIEILEGLKEGDVVITDTTMGAEEGMPAEAMLTETVETAESAGTAQETGVAESTEATETKETAETE